MNSHVYGVAIWEILNYRILRKIITTRRLNDDKTAVTFRRKTFSAGLNLASSLLWVKNSHRECHWLNTRLTTVIMSGKASVVLCSSTALNTCKVVNQIFIESTKVMSCSLKMTATCFSSFHEMHQRFIIFWRKDFLEWIFSADADGQHNILLKLTGAPSAPKGKLILLTFFFNSAAVLSSMIFDVPFSIIFTLITSFSVNATTVPEPLKRSQRNNCSILIHATDNITLVSCRQTLVFVLHGN